MLAEDAARWIWDWGFVTPIPKFPPVIITLPLATSRAALGLVVPIPIKPRL